MSWPEAAIVIAAIIGGVILIGIVCLSAVIRSAMDDNDTPPPRLRGPRS
jgi:hypothetical protein